MRKKNDQPKDPSRVPEPMLILTDEELGNCVGGRLPPPHTDPPQRNWMRTQ